MDAFIATGLKEEILEAVEALGFKEPTPIQAEAIPRLISSNQDLIALAQTGTGKTAAFGLPSIHLTDLSHKNPQTLILAPTRELCLQITKDLTDYARFTKGISVVPVYGGASIDKQIKDIRRAAHIVVGTPGRTRDLINRGRLKLDQIQRVVLDEADEMLTMGFKDDLEAILAATPIEKQTLLFSATMSREVNQVTRHYMVDPFEITVARKNMGASTVEHLYYVVRAQDRYEVLKRLADSEPNIYGIVFCRTRRETKEIAHHLRQDGYNADALHGDLSQPQRDEVMNRFRSRHLQILVATDVAARGLDVEELTHVINFNLPDSAETYTHRSGRTGRAGKEGISIAIIHVKERYKIRDIERYSKISFSQAQVPSGKEICEKQLYALVDKIKKVEVNKEQIAPFLPNILEKLEGLSREELIEQFVSEEFNRFLSYYQNARDINLPPPGKRDKERDRGRGSREGGRRPSFSRLSVNAGRALDMHPARLIGLVNEALGHNQARIGRIDIQDEYSVFEVEDQLAPLVQKSLQHMLFEGHSLQVKPLSGKSHGGYRSSGKPRHYSKRKPGGPGGGYSSRKPRKKR